MNTRDIEPELKRWFGQPLPDEPDSLHAFILQVGSWQAAAPRSRWARSRGTVARLASLAAAVLLAAAMASFALAPTTRPATAKPPAPGVFVQTTSSLPGTSWDTATSLQDGDVLLTGGRQQPPDPAVLAALFDPATGRFDLTGSLVDSGGRSQATATLLEDGRVLLAGGVDASNSALRSAELYDPRTRTFVATGSMSVARVGHSAVRLRDGRVLVMGGGTGVLGKPETVASAELYDPATGLFSPTGSMTAARSDAASVLLVDGSVLVVGGVGDVQLTSAETYHPDSGTFSAVASMQFARQLPTATLLSDGTVLVAGGWGTSGSEASAELFDPVKNSFSSVGRLSTGRYEHVAQRLASGAVLIAGGECGGGPPDDCGGTYGALDSAELYDPATRSFARAGSLLEPRYMGVGALLGDGTVLMAGGQDADKMLSSAEIYRP